MDTYWSAIAKTVVDEILARRQPHAEIGREEISRLRSGGIDVPIGRPPDDDHSWLGLHQDMSSPGNIWLHVDRLARCFWAEARDLAVTDPKLLRLLCEASVYQVYAHERFHHFCDVLGRITGYRGGSGSGYKSDWKTEEALATAYSWREVQRSWPKAKNLPSDLERASLAWWYEEITADGYRDWRRFRSWFERPVTFHLLPDVSRELLTSNGCHTANWLCCALNDCGWHEHSAERWLVLGGQKVQISRQPVPKANKAKGPNDARLATNIDAWYSSNQAETNRHEGDIVLAKACLSCQPGERRCRRLPRAVVGTVICCGCKADSIGSLYSMDISGDFLLCDTEVKGLHNIHKHIKRIGGAIWFSGSPITKQILGLLLIDGLKMIVVSGLTGELLRACEIVNKYLPNQRGMAAVDECQNELIEAELCYFAEL